MTLQEENRIRGTSDIGCRHTTPSPGLRPCCQAHAGVPDAAVQITVLAALVGPRKTAPGVPN